MICEIPEPKGSSQQAAEGAPACPRPWLRRLCAVLGWLVIGLLTVWVVAALYFDVPLTWLRRPLALCYGAAVVGVFVTVKRRRVAMGLCAGGFLLVLAWWLMLPPSNNRDWRPEVAVLPHATIMGNLVTLHNIRNCDYRTETDFDVHHYDKTFDLATLRTADLYLIYWGSPHIAHTMVSFGFDSGDYVCVSIEARKERGESYSAVKGFFRQFELTYVIADERDLVRLRTNHRQNEDVYLYRARMTPEQSRKLFLDYLNRANELREMPEWYNALSDNCTTAVRAQRAAVERAPWSWQMLLNGHLDKLLYKRALTATNLPFAALKERGHINARARLADDGPEFSKRIRENVPNISH